MTETQGFSTPVLFMIFNRPDTTAQVFETIRALKPRFLYVAADGPRLDRVGEAERCLEVRKIIEKVDWDCKVQTLFREKNLGCRHAVSSAVSWFFDQVEEGIILEDDCLPDPSFFTYCSELLEKYRFDTRIMHIGGTNYQNGNKRGDGSYYFSRYPHIWGWASWRRAWKHYDVAMGKFPEFSEKNTIKDLWSDPKMQKAWMTNLQAVYDGKIDTWDHQWTFALYAQNGLSILPNVNLISNIGWGPGATHTTDLSNRLSLMRSHDIGPITHPRLIVGETNADRFGFYRFFDPTFLDKVKHRLSRVWK